MDGRVTACDACNAHGCICDATSHALSENSQSQYYPSANSSTRFINGHSSKQQKTADTRPATSIHLSPSYEIWDGSSPVHDNLLNFYTPSIRAQHNTNSHTWDVMSLHGISLIQNGLPVHPGLLTLANKTSSETQSSGQHVSPSLLLLLDQQLCSSV